MDFDVPAELRDWLGSLREAAREELRPAEQALDRILDPAEAYTSATYREARARGGELGINKLLLPKELGGPDLPPIAFYLAMEELCAAGAPGLALVAVADPLGVALAAGRDHPVFRDYVESFRSDTTGRHSAAWAATEPLVGSDMVREDAPFKARARRTPTGFVLDGAKSRWVSNAWLADMLIAKIQVADEGTGVFLLPMDWPGVVRGTPVDKIGLRALNQADVAFEDCEVPAEFCIFPPSAGYRKLLHKGFLAPGNLSVGFAAVGIARAAYDAGLAYAGVREQGGRPIATHQLVAKRLFDSYTAIEAAQLLLRRAAWDFVSGRIDMPRIFAARVLASRTALQVTADMLYLHGANGLARDHEIEKLFRDAQPLQMADGPTEVVSLEGAGMLVERAAAAAADLQVPAAVLPG